MKLKGAGENEVLWITWEKQTRNRSMSYAIGAKLYELISNRNIFFRYFVLSLKTIKIILFSSEKVIIVQNPSIVLALVAIFVSKVKSKKLVVDAHNSGMYPANGENALLMGVAKYIVRKSQITVVTNEKIAEVVRSWGGNPFVMPDPIPYIDTDKLKSSVSETSYAFLICSWSDDEPYQNVIAAAKMLKDEINLVISGNYRKRLNEKDLSKLPSNVKLTGFINEDEFFTLLKNASVAIDLTTRENCLVCGAYEAIAVNTPCIISDFESNRVLFNKGFVYTENSPEKIADATLFAIRNNSILKEELNKLLVEHRKSTNEKVDDFFKKLAAA